MALKKASLSILNGYSSKLKEDKSLLTRQLADVINKINALELERLAIQRQLDKINVDLGDIDSDVLAESAEVII